VKRAPKAGGSIVTLATGQTLPEGIAVDGSSVYWVNSGTRDQPDGSIMKAPLAGGEPSVLASGQSGPYQIAVDGANVYWTCRGDGTVKKRRK
jgi:hypothetical protein